MICSCFGILFIALFSIVICADVQAAEVTIYRDTYGIPHIYGDNEEAAAFGQGYAQAEDRLETVLKGYLRAQGKMAKAFGEQWIESDYIHRVFRHAEISRERYNELGPEARKFIEFFIAGIKHYMTEHPEKVPPWAEEPEPYHVLALSRHIIWGWPLGQANDDLRREQEDREKPDDGKGSNEWVVGRTRSAEGCVIALIDPHLGWDDQWLFHEAHLHGGDLDVFGFIPVGTPGVGLGHNNYLSWACTTGGPDTADVYEEEINPDNPLQYKYDAEWRDIAVETIEIEVKTEDGIEVVKREIHRTHHGPIVERYGNKAYAFKLAYTDEVLLPEQMYMMNKSKNLGEFLNALGILQFMPQNIMYGDVYGNMFYIRTGRVPIRPDGYDWNRPVPGNTSATEWSGIHGQEDLLQILNPPAGFMQNCNISPGTVTLNSPLTPERYSPYMYNDLVDRSNPRGRRFMEIMEEMDVVAKEDALRIATDVKIQGVGIWQKALVDAYRAYPEDFGELAEAVEIIAEWDHRADIDSVGMTLFFAWWTFSRELGDRFPRDLILEGKPLPRDAGQLILTALKKAVSYMQENYGSIRVSWGEVHRLKRGDKTWPLGGVAKSGLVTLRAVSADDPGEDGIMYARGGQLCTTVVFLDNPVCSYSAVPYGQSEYPDSPHYDDQAENLFSKGLLKPTWYQKEELMEHLESKEILKVHSLERGDFYMRKTYTDEEIWSKIEGYFITPDEFKEDFGQYRPVLTFYDGRPVKSAADWQERRKEILRFWHGAMGDWPKLIEAPEMEYLEEEHTENFTRHKVNLELAPGRKALAYLLVPDGEGPFPAVLDVFYGPESGAGLEEKSRQKHDFGYQLARRGFVALCIGSPGGPQVRGTLADHKNEYSVELQPLSYLAYVAANCYNFLASLPEVDPKSVGIIGHSFGGKWALFASSLYDKFACACYSDPGIVFDETRGNVNYWEPWYLGYETGRNRDPGIPDQSKPRTGAYKKLFETGHDLHELHALMAPRPFFVSGGSEDTPARWKALNHTVAVNTLLGYEQRVGMANRDGHSVTPKANEQICLFFQHFLGSELKDK